MRSIACKEHQCLYSRAIPLQPQWALHHEIFLSACRKQLILYSPYGTYSFYRLPVLVLYSYKSTPSMGRNVWKQPQCLYNTFIPLLTLWTVRPVQNFCACTVDIYLYSLFGQYIFYTVSVTVQYNYTSNPHKCRTAFTGLLCPYSTAIPLLPVWKIQTAQNFSASRVNLILYFPYGPYGLYRTSVPLQYS